MPEGKKPAEDLYSAKTHLHQPVPEVSTVNATALPADAPEGALPSEVRPEIVTWEKLCEAIKASGKAYNMEMIQKAYDLANNAHNGVCRRSGEPYICHPLAVARLVLDLGMDSESIAAAAAHAVVGVVGQLVGFLDHLHIVGLAAGLNGPAQLFPCYDLRAHLRGQRPLRRVCQQCRSGYRGSLLHRLVQMGLGRVAVLVPCRSRDRGGVFLSLRHL